MTSLISTSGIAALAFEFLEIQPISSLADDSPKAQAAAAAYPSALRYCLEAADWSFARQLADLPEADPADPGYVVDDDKPYAYVLPGDCIRVRRVIPSYVEWRTDGLWLRADRPGPLRIHYTAEIDDEGRLPHSFRLAVAWRLAALMPRQITSKSKRDAILADAATALADALEFDRATGSAEPYTDEWLVGDWAKEAQA